MEKKILITKFQYGNTFSGFFIQNKNRHRKKSKGRDEPTQDKEADDASCIKDMKRK